MRFNNLNQKKIKEKINDINEKPTKNILIYSGDYKILDFSEKNLSFEKNVNSIEDTKKTLEKLENKYGIKSLKFLLNENVIGFSINLSYDEDENLSKIGIFYKTKNKILGKDEFEETNDYLKIPSYLSKIGKGDSNLEEKIKSLYSNNQFFNNLRYNDIFGGLSYKIKGLYVAIQDGILELKEGENLTTIHNILGKKSGIINFEFFTPEITSQKLANKINNISGGEEILDIGSGLGQILKYLNNGIGIELNKDYVDILKKEGFNILKKDIEFDKMNKKFKFMTGNPPFGVEINKLLFDFIKENSTNDMEGIFLLPIDYDKRFSKYGFEIISKEDIDETFENTSIKTSIYHVKKIFNI